MTCSIKSLTSADRILTTAVPDTFVLDLCLPEYLSSSAIYWFILSVDSTSLWSHKISYCKALEQLCIFVKIVLNPDPILQSAYRPHLCFCHLRFYGYSLSWFTHSGMEFSGL